MHIAVIGSGYVGIVAAACLAEIGHDVISVDSDAARIGALESGVSPIHENFLPELLARHRNQRLTFSTSVSEAVRNSAVIFIAVGTPSTENGEADMSFVESVSRDIAHALDGYKVVVEKSTVPIYTSEWIHRIVSQNAASQASFSVASNPEFLREGSAIVDFLYPDRIVIGADSEPSAALLRDVYAPLLDGSYAEQTGAIPRPDSACIPPTLIVTDTKSAELVKHASNAFLALKISFINAVANLCEIIGGNVEQVCDGVGADTRIGRRFLNPGIGYGGSCFPKDLTAFRAVARDCGYDFRLLDEVMRINEEQVQRFLRKVRSVLWTLRGKRLAALGLAFKSGTDDIRGSPAVAVIRELLKEGCTVVAYDPAATPRAREVLTSDSVHFADTAYEAAAGADALLILTEWEEFAALDLARLRAQLKYPIVVDGRNLYSPEAMAAQGFTYLSIGRPMASPAKSALSAQPSRR